MWSCALLSVALWMGPPLVGPEHREAVRADRRKDRETRKELRRQRPLIWREFRRYRFVDLRQRAAVLERRERELQAEVDAAAASGGTAPSDLRRRLERIQRMLAETRAELEAGRRARAAFIANLRNTQATKNFRVTPLLGPAYTPERGFLVGGGIQLSWTNDRVDPDLPRSSLPLLFAVNSNGGYGFESRLKTYWLDDRLRWNLDVRGNNVEDHYWGVGFQAARAPLLPSSTTRYRRLNWQVNPEIAVRVWKRLFAGPVVDVNRTIVRDPSAPVARDPNVQRYGLDNFNAGAGFRVAWDNRDVPVNAYRGVYVAASGMWFDDALRSDNDYRVLEVDYRHYLTVVRRGSTIAWRVNLRRTFGDAPYGELSQLGGANDLRGYFSGRYRDVLATFGLVEYRYMFKRGRAGPTQADARLSRHGFVVWGGVGGLGPNFAGLVNWLPNTGFGYRLEIQPRMNIRADLGFGEDTIGFYFNFQESF